jgi:hypothetical protein
VDRGDESPVGATADRVDAEHHATKAGLEQRLYEDGDGLVGGAGPDPGVEHFDHRVDEVVESVDADDRLELARHRRLGGVLDDR